MKAIAKWKAYVKEDLKLETKRRMLEIEEDGSRIVVAGEGQNLYWFAVRGRK